MGTSFGAAIDYLVSGTNPVSSSTLSAALVAVDSTVALADTLPVANQRSLVVIGRNDYDQESSESGARTYLVLGRQKVQEEYDLNCYIECYRDGPAVKTVRDAAIALYDAVVHFVWLDPTLGGLLLDGRIAQVSSLDINVSGGSDKGDTRMAHLPFTIHILNHYIP